MKNKILKIVIPALLLIICFTSTGFSGCKDTKAEPVNNIYENHNISACDVNDPLQNMEWLRELCDSLKETQHFSSVQIDLYKVIGTDENLFKISTSYSEFDNSPYSYTVDWKNCNGGFIIGLCSGTSPSPELLERYEVFLQDKELIADLFHFVKQ